VVFWNLLFRLECLASPAVSGNPVSAQSRCSVVGDASDARKRLIGLQRHSFREIILVCLSAVHRVIAALLTRHQAVSRAILPLLAILKRTFG
jgi:hypothetical protein